MTVPAAVNHLVRSVAPDANSLRATLLATTRSV